MDAGSNDAAPGGVSPKSPLLDHNNILRTIRMLFCVVGIYTGGTGGWTGPTPT